MRAGRCLFFGGWEGLREYKCLDWDVERSAVSGDS